jgi:Na+-translocating ferredoxin:NAD+ oxidoreductase RnfE subunit
MNKLYVICIVLLIGVCPLIALAQNGKTTISVGIGHPSLLTNFRTTFNF